MFCFETPPTLAPCEYLESEIEVAETKVNSEEETKKLGVRWRGVGRMVEQVDGYTPLSFLAEVGGYLGLFLGLSLYQLADFLAFCIDHCQDYCKIKK